MDKKFYDNCSNPKEVLHLLLSFNVDVLSAVIVVIIDLLSLSTKCAGYKLQDGENPN